VSVAEYVHERYVVGRRASVLSRHVANLLPRDAEVLDVGCGDGLLASLILKLRPDTRVRGVDVLSRPYTHVPVDLYDGRHIPFPDSSVDVVMFVDVLHHTHNQLELLREALRVARKGLIVKDHTRDGLFAGTTLKWMDYLGNARHGVAVPGNYWPEAKWRQVFSALNGEILFWNNRLDIYPMPTRWMFDRSLHFLAHVKATNKR
jgi:SAM-dependent methyltransferase